MKDLLIKSLFTIIVLFMISCKSTDPVVVEKVDDSTTEAVAEVIPQANDEPEVQLVPQVDADPEYSRSIEKLAGEVSYDEFQTDKSAILAIIALLDESMRNRDYGDWSEYLTPVSITYWSNKINLQVLSAKIPDNDVTLRRLSDYFIHMFIPSRIGRVVDEIRYISPTEVKAVQVQDDTDIVYYDFVKTDGEWLLELPTL